MCVKTELLLFSIHSLVIPFPNFFFGQFLFIIVCCIFTTYSKVSILKRTNDMCIHVYIILGQPAVSCEYSYRYCSLTCGARAEAIASRGPRSPRLPGLKVAELSRPATNGCVC